LKKHFKSNFIFSPKPQKPVEQSDEANKENIKDEAKAEDTESQKQQEMEQIQDMLEKVKGRQVSHINFDSSIIFEIF
jgi:hypothetical protein